MLRATFLHRYAMALCRSFAKLNLRTELAAVTANISQAWLLAIAGNKSYNDMDHSPGFVLQLPYHLQ